MSKAELKRKIALPTFRGRGLRPGIDLDDSSSLEDVMNEFLDVNVLVYAHREDAPQHRQYRGWLENLLSGPEPLQWPIWC